MKAYPVENFPNYLIVVMSRYEDVFKIGLQQFGLMTDQDPLVFKTSRSGGHVSFFVLANDVDDVDDDDDGDDA